jgi:hypothetical protein
MKISSMMLGAVLASSGVAYGGDDATQPDRVAMSKSKFSEYRADCIEAGIAQELPNDQLKLFVEQCVADREKGIKSGGGGGGD